MAKKSIGQLNATVTADAAQFVNEMARADNAARRHGAAISGEIGRVTKDIQRDFSAGKFAKGFMGGLGIGGGVEVARLGFQALEDVFTAPAREAKAFTEYVTKMRAELDELHGRRFEVHLETLAPGLRAKAISDEIAERRRKIADAEAQREQARADYSRTTAPDFQAGSAEGMALKSKYGVGAMEDGASWYEVWKFTGAAAIGAEAQKMIDEAQARVEAQQVKLDALGKKGAASAEAAGKAVDLAVTEFFKDLDTSSKTWRERVEALEKSVQTPEEKLSAASRTAWDLFNAGDIDDRLRERLLRRASDEFEQLTTKPPAKRPDLSGFSVKADDLTRRGLGTGAGYVETQRASVKILGEMLDLMRREANRRNTPPVFAD